MSNAMASLPTLVVCVIEMYGPVVDRDESDQRLALLHEKVRKYGTVFNTIAPGTQLSGRLIRKGIV
jgi:hypothetical protein